MAASSWIVTKPRSESKLSPRLSPKRGEPFVVTIVEPPHFEVPDNTLRSNVSTHSLLTTDTASNREGSMASSPGSSEHTSMKSQSFQKNQFSPRSLVQNAEPAPLQQRPPRWSDGGEGPHTRLPPTTYGVVNNAHRITEGSNYCTPDTDDRRATPSIFEVMESSECGEGSALATARWHYSSKAHEPVKGRMQMESPACSSTQETDSINKRDTCTRKKPHEPDDSKERNQESTPTESMDRNRSSGTSFIQTRGHDSFRFAFPYVPDADLLINENSGKYRDDGLHHEPESLLMGTSRPIHPIREHEVEMSTKSSPRSVDVDCLQEVCESPMSEGFYLNEQPRRTPYSNLIFEKAQNQLEAMISSGIPCSRGEEMISPFSSVSVATPGQGDSSTGPVVSLREIPGDCSRSGNSKDLPPKDSNDQPSASSSSKGIAQEAHAEELRFNENDNMNIPRKSAGTRRPTHRANQYKGSSALVCGDLRYPQPGEDFETDTAENDSEEVDYSRPPSPLEAAKELESLEQMSNYNELISDNEDFRKIVYKLKQVARSGSLGKLREMLGVEEVRRFQEVNQAGSQDLQFDTMLRPNNIAGKHIRQETMFFDAQEDLLSGDGSTREGAEHRGAQSVSYERTGVYNDESIYNHKNMGGIGRSETDEVAATALGLQVMVQQAKLMKLNESSQAASAETNPSGVTAAVQATPDTITNRARLLSGSRNSSGRSDSSKSRSALNKFVSMFPKMKRSKGSAASFSSQQDSDGQTDSLPSSRLNALDEDVSFYKAAEQSREPDGAASPALPPHPLDEIASARLGNAVHEVEDSWGKGSSENGFNKTIITSQDQQCVLKLSFHLQGAQSLGGSSKGSDSGRRHAHSRASQKRQEYTRAMQASSQPKKPSLHNILSPRIEAYRPTNDVNQILKTTRKDCKTWRGPLTDAEFLFYMKYNGKWKANWGVSDSYDSLCKVMELGWVFRKGLDASDVIVFDHSELECKSIAKIVGVLNLTERRPWAGTVTPHKRRDHRSGTTHCWVERYDGGFTMRLNWDNPLAGTIYESVELTADSQRLVLRQDLYRKEGGLSSHIRIVFDRVG